MSQIDPLVFGAIVFALVGAAVFVPKLFSGPKGPTADDVFVDSLPSRYAPRITVPAPQAAAMSVTPPEQLETPAGAPRAVAPTRQAAQSSAPPVSAQPGTTTPAASVPPSVSGLAPLRLPVD